MADINAVSLSGVLSGDVEISKTKDMEVAWFFLEIEETGERRPQSKFMVVAFAEWAVVAKMSYIGFRMTENVTLFFISV